MTQPSGVGARVVIAAMSVAAPRSALVFVGKHAKQMSEAQC